MVNPFYGFPIWSSLALLYLLVATVWVLTNTPISLVAGRGYGIRQLGYVLTFVGILTGKFGALGLEGRWTISWVGVGTFLIGVVLSNLGS